MRLTTNGFWTTSLVVFTALAGGPVRAADVAASSAVDAVTVYPDGASVTRIISLDLPAGENSAVLIGRASGTWTHGGGFAGYHEAREARLERLTRDRSWFDDERQRLVEIVVEMRRRAKISDGFAPKLKAAETKWEGIR